MKKPSVIPTYHPAYESIRNPSRPLTDARPDEEQSSSLLETDTLCVEVSAVLTPVGHRAFFFITAYTATTINSVNNSLIIYSKGGAKVNIR